MVPIGSLNVSTVSGFLMCMAVDEHSVSIPPAIICTLPVLELGE